MHAKKTMTKIGRQVVCAVMLLFLVGGTIALATGLLPDATSAVAAADAPQPRPAPANVAEPAPTTNIRAKPKRTEAQFPAAAENAKPPPVIDLNRRIVLHGKVFGPGNLPLAAARLFVSADYWTDPVELGTTDAEGAYRFAAPERIFRKYMDETHKPEVQAALIVVAEGLAPAWANLPADTREGWGVMKPEYAQDFHLGADFPITGQIVDAGGSPVAGAEIAVTSISSLADPGWEPMRAAIKAGTPEVLDRKQSHPDAWATTLHATAWRMLEPVTTDVEGRFEITGMGHDRAIRLRVEGPTVRTTHIGVLTRADVADFTQAIRGSGAGGVPLFGPTATIEVDRARTIAGVVRDAKTRAPVSNVRMVVITGKSSGMSAYTDRRGRYRIVLADDPRYLWIYAQPRRHEQYSSAARRFGRRIGEIVANFDLSAGVIVSGRVLETGTDRPIVSAPIHTCHAPWPGAIRAGFIYYFPLATNAGLRATPEGAYLEAAPEGATNYYNSVPIGADGEYSIAVPPGPGVLIVQSAPGMPEFGAWGVWKESAGFHRLFPYLPLTGRTKNDGAPAGNPQSLPGFNGPIPLANGNYHAYRVINPPADVTKLDLPLNVPRAQSRTLRFVTPDGNATRGVRVQGLLAPPQAMTVVFDGSEAEVLALEPGEPREVIAISNDGQFVAKVALSTDDPEPRTIRLNPAASLAGRLLDDATGLPLVDYSATLIYPRAGGAAGMRNFDWGGQVKTDEEGRFMIGTVIPDSRVSIWIQEARPAGLFLGTMQEYKLDSLRDLRLRTGEERELGEIRINRLTDAESAKKRGN